MEEYRVVSDVLELVQDFEYSTREKAIICVRTWNNENDKENLINYN